MITIELECGKDVRNADDYTVGLDMNSEFAIVALFGSTVIAGAKTEDGYIEDVMEFKSPEEARMEYVGMADELA